MKPTGEGKHLLTNLITTARPFLFHVITHLEREKSVRAGDKSQEMMIGTVTIVDQALLDQETIVSSQCLS